MTDATTLEANVSAASRRVLAARERAYRAPVWNRDECAAAAAELLAAQVAFTAACKARREV